MLEPLEMVTASCMQNMVEIRKGDTYFVTIFFFFFCSFTFRALGVESPGEGAMEASHARELFFVTIIVVAVTAAVLLLRYSLIAAQRPPRRGGSGKSREEVAALAHQLLE